jgi:hypothetical protein
LSGRGLCDELITRPEESYRLCCVVVCDLETSGIGTPYIYDISHLRVNTVVITPHSQVKFAIGHNILSCVASYQLAFPFHNLSVLVTTVSAFHSSKKSHYWKILRPLQGTEPKRQQNASSNVKKNEPKM